MRRRHGGGPGDDGDAGTKRGGHRPRLKEGVGPDDDGGAVDGGHGDDPGDDDTAEEAARSRQPGAEAQAPISKRRAQAVQQGAVVQARNGLMNLLGQSPGPERKRTGSARTKRSVARKIEVMIKVHYFL